MEFLQGKEIGEAIETIVREISPETIPTPKYGGTVFDKKHNKERVPVCGCFIYSKHVSLEFTNGSQLLDNDNILEGAGKYRRHIKLYSVTDMALKKVPYFIEQAFQEVGANS